MVHQDLSKMLFSCFASNILLALVSHNVMVTGDVNTDSSIATLELTLTSSSILPSTIDKTSTGTASTTTPLQSHSAATSTTINSSVISTNSPSKPLPTTPSSTTNKTTSPIATTTSKTTSPIATTTSKTTSPIATTTSKTKQILSSTSSVSPSASAVTESSSSTAPITSTLECTDYTTTITEAPTPAPSTETPQVTIPLQITKTPPNFKYITFDPDIGNDCRRFDYEFNEEYSICTHKCENINCLNGGECAVTVEGKDRITVGCRCPSTEDLVYSGTTCENSQMSRLKERRITLGILIPIVFLSLLLLICVYAKLRHYGSTERSFRNNNYNVNTGNL